MIKINKITQEEIEKMERIKQDCADLHFMQPPITSIEARIEDIESGDVELEYTSLSKTWVHNAYHMMSQMFLGSITELYEPMGSKIRMINDQDIGNKNYSKRFAFSTGTPNYTLIIGSGNAAENYYDHNLTSTLFINAGSNVILPTYDTSNKRGSVRVLRTFSNTSGQSVNVGEVGLFASPNYIYDEFGSFTQNQAVMLARDIFNPVLTIGNQQALSIVYRIDIQFPSGA